jgi:hypothetical protein
MNNKPEKVFPCDCMSEGIMVHTEFEGYDRDTVSVSRDGDLEDNYNYYGVHLSFWGMGPYHDGKLTWRRRLAAAWHLLKYGHPWTDMVMLTPGVAKKLANHILYRVEQMETKLEMKPDELKILKISPQTKEGDQEDPPTLLS